MKTHNDLEKLMSKVQKSVSNPVMLITEKTKLSRMTIYRFSKGNSIKKSTKDKIQFACIEIIEESIKKEKFLKAKTQQLTSL